MIAIKVSVRHSQEATHASTRMSHGRFRKMIQIKAGPAAFHASSTKMWKPIPSAPFDCDLELAVLDEDGEHALVFPCIKGREGWRNAVTGARVDIRPTHWREWKSERAPANDGKSLDDFR